jgi:hypothetical protein
MGCVCIDPRIPDLGISWRLVVTFTPRPLYPRTKSPWYPLDRRLGGPQNRSGRLGEEKNLAPTGTRTPTPRPTSRSQSLYRLSYPGLPETHTPLLHEILLRLVTKFKDQHLVLV